MISSYIVFSGFFPRTILVSVLVRVAARLVGEVRVEYHWLVVDGAASMAVVIGGRVAMGKETFSLLMAIDATQSRKPNRRFYEETLS